MNKNMYLAKRAKDKWDESKFKKLEKEVIRLQEKISRIPEEHHNLPESVNVHPVQHCCMKRERTPYVSLVHAAWTNTAGRDSCKQSGKHHL